MTPQQIIEAYQRAYLLLRIQTAQRTTALWTSSGGLTESELSRWLRQAIPLAVGIRRTTASLTIGYLLRLAAQMGQQAKTPELPTDLTGRGVADVDLYTRPVVTARVAIAAGKPFEAAMDLARQRATAITTADVMLTQRTATTATLRGSRASGYRRVLTGQSCDLCVTASRQIYRVDSVAPVHDRCDCSYSPIFDSDPAETINKRRVSRDPDVDVSTRTHGELGPVLVVSDHQFKGPSDV